MKSASRRPAFNAAENDEEQVTQRAVIGALVDRVLRANSDLADKVKGRLHHQRYAAV